MSKTDDWNHETIIIVLLHDFQNAIFHISAGNSHPSINVMHQVFFLELHAGYLFGLTIYKMFTNATYIHQDYALFYITNYLFKL